MKSLAWLSLVFVAFLISSSAFGDIEAERLLASPSGEIPETIAGYRRVAVYHQDYAIRFLFVAEGKEPIGPNVIEFLLTRRDDTRSAFAKTRSFDIAYRGPSVAGAPAPDVKPLADAVVSAIERNDEGSLVLAQAPFVERPDSKELRLWQIYTRIVVDLGLVLVILFFLLSPFMGYRLWCDVKSGIGDTLSWTVLGVTTIGLVLRLILPHQPVMYYMGYRLAAVAAELADVPKYGPGALALYHLLFKVTGTSHLAMAYANSVIGGILPFASAALVLACGGGRVASMAATVFVALTPLFVRDSTTESLLVPTMLWLICGLAMAARSMRTGSLFDISTALLLLTLATWSRPETVVLVPLALGALMWLWPRGHFSKWTWVLVGCAALLFIIRIIHLIIAVQIELERGNSPILTDFQALLRIPTEHLNRNIVFWPSLFPAGVATLAVIGLFSTKLRTMLRAVAMLFLAVLWLTISFLDLPYVSLPRVQAPGLLFVTLLASYGMENLWSAVARVIRSQALLAAIFAGVSAVMAVSMGVTVPSLWAKTNADDEEELLQDARAVLADTRSVLVRRSYDDQPVERIHLFYPDYWFTSKGHIVVGPDRFAAMKKGSRPAYFLLGIRCYLRECGQSDMHPACRRMLDEYRLTPVFERIVPVRRLDTGRDTRPDQDLDFPWCITASDSMRIGLYRIEG